MALIEKLTKLRFDNFLKEFNIDIDDFNHNNTRVKWEQLKRKFIGSGYISECCNFIDCFFVIKNIVWKNLITYSFVDKKLHIIMHFNDYKYISSINNNLCDYNVGLSYDIFRCDRWYESYELKDNCIALQKKIINYIILLDILVAKYLICDLVYPIKNYMFYVMLLI